MNQTLYENYQIISNYSDVNKVINIKVIDVSNNNIFIKDIHENDLSIKPLNKFYHIFNQSIDREPNYSFVIKELNNDDSEPKLKIIIKFSYNLIDISETIILDNKVEKKEQNVLSELKNLINDNISIDEKINILVNRYEQVISKQSDRILELEKQIDEILNQKVIIGHKQILKYIDTPPPGVKSKSLKQEVYENKIISFSKNAVEIDLSDYDKYINPSVWLHFTNLQTLKIKNLSNICKNNHDCPIIFHCLEHLIIDKIEYSESHLFYNENFPEINILTIGGVDERQETCILQLICRSSKFKNINIVKDNN